MGQRDASDLVAARAVVLVAKAGMVGVQVKTAVCAGVGVATT